MKTVLKILVAPVTLTISLLVWLGILLIDRAVLLFQIASGILTALAVLVLLTTSVTNGLILLGIALAVSPIGLPMLAVKLLGCLQSINLSLKGFVHSCKAPYKNAPRCLVTPGRFFKTLDTVVGNWFYWRSAYQ